MLGKKNDLFLNHSQSKSMVLFTYGRLKFVSTAVTAPVDLIKLKFEGNFSANEQFAKWSAAHFFSNEDLR